MSTHGLVRKKSDIEQKTKQNDNNNNYYYYKNNNKENNMERKKPSHEGFPSDGSRILDWVHDFTTGPFNW